MAHVKVLYSEPRAMYHPIAYTFISYNMVKRTVKVRLKDPRGDAKFYSILPKR